MKFTHALKNKRVRHGGLVHRAKKVHVGVEDKRTCVALLRCGEGKWTDGEVQVTKNPVTCLECLA